MKTLLRIDCSARIQGSHSRALANYFEKEWKKANTDGHVIFRDLAKHQLPHIQNNTIQGFYTPESQITNKTIKAAALSDALISELKSADELLISSPLYNLNIPSNLKAYIDQVTRIGHTFNINTEGYYGLLKDKTAYLITVKGGSYKGSFMEQFDFQEPYLKAILGHMGIHLGKLFSVEGSSEKKVYAVNEKKAQESIYLLFNN